MINTNVSKLYNGLFSLESKFRSTTYPIHKKLQIERDIYDMILDFLPADCKSDILDAGCGVGFGTQLLTKRTNANVHGITISDKECERARQNNKFNDRCQYFHAGIESILPNSYDIIICVESLKHTLQPSIALDVLEKALKPNGKLIVVDDFFSGGKDKYSIQFMKDWELSFLINEYDLNNVFLLEHTKDLTSLMAKKSIFKIYLILAFCKLLKRNANFTKLMRGATLLDKLYFESKMNYKLNVYSKPFSI